MIEIKLYQTICEKYGVGLVELLGSTRRNKIVEARAELALKLREEGFSYPEIGALIGNRNHTTIMNLIGIANKKLSTG